MNNSYISFTAFIFHIIGIIKIVINRAIYIETKTVQDTSLYFRRIFPIIGWGFHEE